MLNYLFQDSCRNKGHFKSIFILSFYRLISFFAVKEKYSLVWVLGLPLMVLYRVTVECFLCVELRGKTKVGKGLKIEHGYGLVINDNTVIGDNVHLRHSTTIGCKMNDDGSQGPSPSIGNGVEVGANAVIIGGLVVGDNSTIGAGSVVLHDVPPNSVVVGNPAKIIKTKEV